METCALTDEGFWLDRTERCIFSKIAFIDYGYFYDLDEQEYEFTYRREIEDKVMRYILTGFAQENPSFRDYVELNNSSLTSITEGIRKEGRLSMCSFFNRYEKIFQYFDDWVLIKTDADDIEVTDIIVKKKEETHIETCIGVLANSFY